MLKTELMLGVGMSLDLAVVAERLIWVVHAGVALVCHPPDSSATLTLIAQEADTFMSLISLWGSLEVNDRAHTSPPPSGDVCDGL